MYHTNEPHDPNLVWEDIVLRMNKTWWLNNVIWKHKQVWHAGSQWECLGNQKKFRAAGVRKEVKKMMRMEEWAEADYVMPNRSCYHVFGVFEELQRGHCDWNNLRGILNILAMSGDQFEHEGSVHLSSLLNNEIAKDVFVIQFGWVPWVSKKNEK